MHPLRIRPTQAYCYAITAIVLSWNAAIGYGTAASFAGAPTKKHVIAILADDYGWGNVGYHRPEGYDEVRTPNIDGLVRQGIELDRFYVFKFCSPTRSAAQTGRNPIHVNTVNLDPLNYNPKDNISGYAAVPHNMTGIAEVMKEGGYSTAFFGKWDCGMATMRHTPKGRGYDHSLHYFHHMEDYWQNEFENPNGQTDFFPQCKSIVSGVRPRDLWLANSTYEGPALGFTNESSSCSVGTYDLCSLQQENECPPYPGYPGPEAPGCTYVDRTFTDNVLDTIRNHDPSNPLFLFWAPHTIHSPLEVPKTFYDEFSFIPDWRRRRYHAMVAYMDSRIGEVVSALKASGMYDDSVIFFSSDNGGPIYQDGAAGANNYPLKGGKASNWEGGIRVNAFVSGGAVPVHQQGKKLDGLATIWDWYTTFAAIAGIDPTDRAAKEAGLPPIDGLNLWPYLSGIVPASPRTQVIIGTGDGDVAGAVWKNGTDIWKYLSGVIPQAGWTSAKTPNATYVTPKAANCAPCVYKLDSDPSEYQNRANSTPSGILQHLQYIVQQAADTGFHPDRGPQDPQSCVAAITKYPRYWGPWVNPEFGATDYLHY